MNRKKNLHQLTQISIPDESLEKHRHEWEGTQQAESPNFISICTGRIKALHSVEIYTKISCCTDLVFDFPTDKQEIPTIF